jgi:hypothetical protein
LASEYINVRLLEREEACQILVIVDTRPKSLALNVLLSLYGYRKVLVVLVSCLPYLDNRDVLSQVECRIIALAEVKLEVGICEEYRAEIFARM